MFCPHSVFMCFVWIWKQTAIISLYSINWLVFIRDFLKVSRKLSNISKNEFSNNMCFCFLSTNCSLLSICGIFVHSVTLLCLITTPYKTSNVRIASYRSAFMQPFLLWKSSEYYKLRVCVCSLRYPTCNTHAPYHFVICCLLDSTKCSTLSHKRHEFWKKKLLNIKCVLTNLIV